MEGAETLVEGHRGGAFGALFQAGLKYLSFSL